MCEMCVNEVKLIYHFLVHIWFEFSAVTKILTHTFLISFVHLPFRISLGYEWLGQEADSCERPQTYIVKQPSGKSVAIRTPVSVSQHSQWNCFLYI